MKILQIQLGTKTYTAAKLTARHTRKAVEINQGNLNLAKKQLELQSANNQLEAASEVLAMVSDLATRKACLICEVYENRFSVDELEASLSDDEIDEQITKITAGGTDTMTKN